MRRPRATARRQIRRPLHRFAHGSRGWLAGATERNRVSVTEEWNLTFPAATLTPPALALVSPTAHPPWAKGSPKKCLWLLKRVSFPLPPIRPWASLATAAGAGARQESWPLLGRQSQHRLQPAGAGERSVLTSSGALGLAWLGCPLHPCKIFFMDSLLR